MAAKTATSAVGGARPGGSKRTKTNEELFAEFQTLRNEQRQIASKISELEMDLNEHKIVIDTLNNVNEDRKCFRMVGGVLCERTVKDVMPELISNRDRLPQLIASLNEQLTKKGAEVNKYIADHNIRIQKTDEVQQQEHKDTANNKSNVLVTSN